MPEPIQEQPSGKPRESTNPLIAPSSPPFIPDHDLLRCIGRGSYGEVWLARNVVGTWRALKIVHRATFERADHFEREFRGIQKFEPISRSHEGFVDILQIGRDDEAGYFYYVMELADSAEVRGQKSEVREQESPSEVRPTDHRPLASDFLLYTPHTLRAEQQRQGRLPISDCVDIGITLASALAHLHKHGLVHRDIKPSNIIFVGGVPKLADIGLVADASEARSFVGTVGFIPPEGPGSPQADLYSLGKVLYEISTGQDRQDFPQLPPDLLRGDARGTPSPGGEGGPNQSLRTSAATSSNDAAPLVELNEVVLKACHKDLGQRYASADSMMSDLELLQRGQSVQRKHLAEKRWAFAKRITLVAISVALVLAMSWFVLDHFGQQRARNQRGQLAKSWKPSPESKKLYDQGWTHLLKQTKDGIARSIDCFNRAIELEPNYALAYCGLADAYWTASEVVVPPVQALAEMRNKAKRAVEIDDHLPDGHKYLGLALFMDFDIARGEVELKRAVELGPNDAWSHNFYALLLRCTGRVKEAGAFQLKARQLDRTDPQLLIWDCRQLCSERRFEEALQLAQEHVQSRSNSLMTPIILSEIHVGMHRFEEAATEIRKVRTADDDPSTIASLGYVYGRLGKTNEARALLQEMENLRNNRYVSGCSRALVHAGLGETNEAIRQLQLAYGERSSGLLSLEIDPRWDDIRAAEGFVELLKKVGLEK